MTVMAGKVRIDQVIGDRFGFDLFAATCTHNRSANSPERLMIDPFTHCHQ